MQSTCRWENACRYAEKAVGDGERAWGDFEGGGVEGAERAVGLVRER